MLCPLPSNKNWQRLLKLKNNNKGHALILWNAYKENIPDYIFEKLEKEYAQQFSDKKEEIVPVIQQPTRKTVTKFSKFIEFAETPPNIEPVVNTSKPVIESIQSSIVKKIEEPFDFKKREQEVSDIITNNEGKYVNIQLKPGSLIFEGLVTGNKNNTKLELEIRTNKGSLLFITPNQILNKESIITTQPIVTTQSTVVPQNSNNNKLVEEEKKQVVAFVKNNQDQYININVYNGSGTYQKKVTGNIKDLFFEVTNANNKSEYIRLSRVANLKFKPATANIVTNNQNTQNTNDAKIKPVNKILSEKLEFVKNFAINNAGNIVRIKFSNQEGFYEGNVTGNYNTFKIEIVTNKGVKQYINYNRLIDENIEYYNSLSDEVIVPKSIEKQEIIDKINQFSTIESLTKAWKSEKFTTEQKKIYKSYFSQRKQDILNTKINSNVNKDKPLFGLDVQNQEKLEFHINTLSVIGKFLENIGIEQRLVPEFLSQDGNVVEGAIAAANFVQGTVDVIDDINKRPEAWNKLPEEAAHWWYRLLNENSPIKKALWKSHLIALKNDELYKSNYGNLVSKSEELTEESIGQLIAEAIKRIETKNASPEDYSFFKKFLEWINSLLYIFKDTTQDPFEVAAMKILSSDMSDLMTWEEYRKLNNIVNFADVLTEQSVAPIDLTLMSREDSLPSGYVFVGKVNDETEISYNFRDNEHISNPYFYSKEEFEDWFSKSKYYNEYLNKQKAIIQEVRDTQQFFDRLLNKTFRKRSKYLSKTLSKYYTIVDSQNLNPLQGWNISQQLMKITKKLTEEEKKQIIKTNGYTNIAPTLKVLPDILQKYGRKTTPEIVKQEIEITNKLVKKEITKEQAVELRQKLENKKKGNPIILSEPIKIDGAKKQELAILNGIKEMIKLENPSVKTITAEEFVAEVHNWLKTNYLLGFANEQVYLSYRTDQTFTYLNDRNTDEDITNLTDEEIQNIPFDERQRLANMLGLTKQNPDVYHNKVSLRFNDFSHIKSGHFNLSNGGSPSAWGNLTYFYSGKSKWKDAVLLHEIQNDNIEFLREFKTQQIDLETSIGNYLQELNKNLLDNITQIESGGKKVTKKMNFYENPPKNHLFLNNVLRNSVDLGDGPFQGFETLKQRTNEQIELYNSDNSIVNRPEKAFKQLDTAYLKKNRFSDLLKRGGIKSLLSNEDIKFISKTLYDLNQFNPEINNFLDLSEKKSFFKTRTATIEQKINNQLKEKYGIEVPYISLLSPIKTRSRTQIRQGVARSEELNENLKQILFFTEQTINKQLSKNIENAKKDYNKARNSTAKYNFNLKLSKITQEQYSSLIENYKYNQELLEKAVDEQIKKDLEKESLEISKLTDKEILKDITDYKRRIGIEILNRRREEGIEVQEDKIFKYKNIKLNSKTKEDAIEEVRNMYDFNSKNSLMLDQSNIFGMLKQQALDKKEELEKNYGQLENEVKETLEIEMNYFTPLVHHLIQKHINQYGKEIPMYFSGYNITKLTQGNDRTAMIYAGKDEINIVDRNSFIFNGNRYESTEQSESWQKNYYKGNEYSLPENDENIEEKEFEKAYQQATERKAKEIKYQAALQLQVLENSNIVSVGDLKKLTDIELEEGIKKLNDFKKIPKSSSKSKYNYKSNLDLVVETIMGLNNSKPIETGAIYNAMTQISGIKLIWQDKIEGIKSIQTVSKSIPTGGYLVDLSNYNYNTPILYGLEKKNKEIKTDKRLSRMQVSEELKDYYTELQLKHDYNTEKVQSELKNTPNVSFYPVIMNEEGAEVGVYYDNTLLNPNFPLFGTTLEGAIKAVIDDAITINLTFKIIDNNSEILGNLAPLIKGFYNSLTSEQQEKIKNIQEIHDSLITPMSDLNFIEMLKCKI